MCVQSCSNFGCTGSAECSYNGITVKLNKICDDGTRIAQAMRIKADGYFSVTMSGARSKSVKRQSSIWSTNAGTFQAVLNAEATVSGAGTVTVPWTATFHSDGHKGFNLGGPQGSWYGSLVLKTSTCILYMSTASVCAVAERTYYKSSWGSGYSCSQKLSVQASAGLPSLPSPVCKTGFDPNLPTGTFALAGHSSGC